jgi:hypothetical protein
MDHNDNFPDSDKILDPHGNLPPDGNGFAFVATFAVVALIGLLAWGIGYVEVQPYSSSTTVSELPMAPTPPLLPTPQPVPPKT